MIRAFNCVAILVVIGVFLASWATAGDLSAEYLYGRWVVGEQNCSSPDAEYFEFRKNGTYESNRKGRPEVVGFWGLDKDILKLHMLTSLAYFDDIHKTMSQFEGKFNYFQTQVIIFNNEQSSFEAIGVTGDVVRRTNAVRCQ